MNNFNPKNGFATVKFLYTTVKKLYTFYNGYFFKLLIISVLHFWHVDCYAGCIIINCKIIALWKRELFW